MSSLALNDPNVANTLSPVFASVSSLADPSTTSRFGNINTTGLIAYSQGLFASQAPAVYTGGNSYALSQATSGTTGLIDLSPATSNPLVIMLPPAPGYANMCSWKFAVVAIGGSSNLSFVTNGATKSSMVGTVSWSLQPASSLSVGSAIPINLVPSGSQAGVCTARFNAVDSGDNAGVRVGDVFEITQMSTATSNTVVLRCAASYPNGVNSGGNYTVFSIV